MDELYAFLFAGLFIMFLLFAFFGGPEVSIISDSKTFGADSSKDYRAEDILWKEIDLGDIISEERIVRTQEVFQDQVSVQNGFFFGSTNYARKIDLDPSVAENLEGAAITFDVDETNNYGDLTVTLDNSTLYLDRSIRGSYRVDVSGMQKTSVVHISTSSSGWRVWAPSKYELSDLGLEYSYRTREASEYEFDVPHYVYNSFYKGELKFDSVYPADLEIFLNGASFYNGRDCSGRTNIKLSRKDLVPEENTIKFVSGSDFRLEGAKVYLYYQS
ncbi:MAG: hypothetical protein JW727_03950 [Candidatus Aenigmarchaeota archaeon]|nr:hypothetical protein [Candidatus Aenigmarchaeota archaeon]